MTEMINYYCNGSQLQLFQLGINAGWPCPESWYLNISSDLQIKILKNVLYILDITDIYIVILNKWNDIHIIRTTKTRE